MVQVWWMLGVAIAGYGDPVDGYPSWQERDLHLWTNAARVSPLQFTDDYAIGGCSIKDFRPEERLPQRPLRYNLDLGHAARFHTRDMIDNDFFAHESSDGTSLVERVGRYYGLTRPFGENILRGLPTARQAVMLGFMCSDGHRDNLMRATWDELGTGAIDEHWTQNFGRSGVSGAIGVGVHEPREPDSLVFFYVDVYDARGREPDRVEVVLDGEVRGLGPAYGMTPSSAVWMGIADVAPRCTPYYFEVAWGSEVVRYPEGGSYAYGPCEYDDPGAQWLDVQVEPGQGPYDEDPELDTDSELLDDTDPAEEEVDLVPWTNLCSTLGAGALGGPVLFLAMGVIRRRRRMV